MRLKKSALFLVCAGALLAGCNSPGSRSDLERRMQLLIRAVTDGDVFAGNPLVRSVSGGPGGLEVKRVHDDYEQLKTRLNGQAAAAPIPAGAEIPQALQTGTLPADPHGLYLIEYFSLGRGNLPKLVNTRQVSPTRIELDTAVGFHFDTIEYRRYPDHTTVPLPIAPLGTIGAFNLGLARVPPRTVPKSVTLRWSFLHWGAEWTLETLTIVPDSLVWVTDARPL